jgi:hypothetical protein
MKPVLRVAAATTLLLSGLILAAPSGAQPAPTVTVAPDTDLVDGDLVQLEGTGFAAGGTVFFCQGTVESADDDPDPTDCGAPISAVTANSAGAFSATYTVHRYLSLSGIGTVDCAQPSAGCLIGAANLGAPGAVDPVTFRPQPPASLTVAPDADLLDDDVVLVEGTSFPARFELDLCQGGSVAGLPAGCDLSTLQAVTTDDAGGFSASFAVNRFVTPLSTPTIDCAAAAGGCYIQAGVFDPVSLLTPITFAPQPPPEPLFGTVTDADGIPLAGVEVWAYAPDDAWVAARQATTGAGGSFAFDEIDPDIGYRLLFRPPTGSTLESQWFEDRPNRRTATVVTVPSGGFAQANAQLHEGATISGAVTDAAGSPLAGVTVSAFGPYDTWAPSHLTATGPDGRFLIDAVRGREIFQPGASYLLRFEPAPGSGLAVEWYDDAPTRRAATPVAVSDGQDVTGIDAILQPTP